MRTASTSKVPPRDPVEFAGARRVVRPRKGAERVTLRVIREGLGLTQGELARLLETDQGEISRIERRPDLMLSTLRRYADALGATCEIAFVFPDGRRVLVGDPEQVEPPR